MSVKREWAILEDATNKFTVAKRLKTAVEEDRDELKATVTRLCDEIHEAKAKMAEVKKLFSKHVEDLQDKVITLSADLDALSEGNRSFLDALGEAAAEVSEQDEQALDPNERRKELYLDPPSAQ
ncbi:uncharacterized protein ACA1_014230 [Acanthamoeba castellanii str. Neff]|uniref:Uncharacterized protein n=1 Tax=Acanthamoeba castellanii (strain ATCC 30010 / Neff) TaxID=1257118 RepID=L8GH27_ACACF|nr:uncharacterized protein ACA1_014230 [Acanthamoeba castellanii str. Neff]ELR12114.1 hypothetical protein ACA1_014230 [Acanthamoeba castellanii str. Neff]